MLVQVGYPVVMVVMVFRAFMIFKAFMVFMVSQDSKVFMMKIEFGSVIMFEQDYIEIDFIVDFDIDTKDYFKAKVGVVEKLVALVVVKVVVLLYFVVIEL